MKMIIFVLPLLAMMVVGCNNPANNDSTVEETVTEKPASSQTSQETESDVVTPKIPEVNEEVEVPEEKPAEPEQPESSKETEVSETPVEPEKPQEQEISEPVEDVPAKQETIQEPEQKEETPVEQPVEPQEPEQKEETPVEQPVEPQEPEEPEVVEDKSPYEYVLPTGVSYDDYTYVGDYVFSDLYDFENCIWFNGTANSEYGYFMVLEKIARVKYNGDDEQIFYLYDFDTDTYPALEKGTKYKIYFKKSFLDSKPGTTLDDGKIRIIHTFGATKDKNPDRNTFVILANDDTYNAFTIQGCVDVNDYVAY